MRIETPVEIRPEGSLRGDAAPPIQRCFALSGQPYLTRTIHESQKNPKEAGSDGYFPEREKQGSAHAPSGFARDGKPWLAAMQDCIASQVFLAASRDGFTAVRKITIPSSLSAPKGWLFMNSPG